jgi:hypothetical protein
MKAVKSAQYVALTSRETRGILGGN